MTCMITVACTAYACYTKTDFTICGGALWLLSMSLLMFGLMTIIFPSYIGFMIYSALGVFLFGIYLIFDTQLIMGKGKYKLSIDDYIAGALILYADIITIFLYILAMCGRR